MANPIISRVELEVSGTPLTTQGVVRKTGILLAITAAVALGFFGYGWQTQMSPGFSSIVAMGAIAATFMMGLMFCAKPLMAKSLAMPYAVTEGLFVGAISLRVAYAYPGVAFSALSATFVTAVVMLGLYRSGVIKVTEKFRSIMISAILAIVILYVIQFVMMLMGTTIPVLFSGGIVAIGFSVLVTIIASLSLLLDFDSIDRAKAAGVSQDYEWVLGVGVLATLVWMYSEFLRLLSYVNNR